MNFSMKKEISKLEADKSTEILEVQIATLEKTIRTQQREASCNKEELENIKDSSAKELVRVKTELESKVEKVKFKSTTLSRVHLKKTFNLLRCVTNRDPFILAIVEKYEGDPRL